MLPPLLQQLELMVGVSPRVLATLQLLPSFRHLYVRRIQIGMSGVGPDNRILPETVDAIGSAMQLIRSYLPVAMDLTCYDVDVAADCKGSALGPGGDGDQQLSHTGWLRTLAGLRAFKTLTLSGMQLQERDLECLACTLPDLEVGNCGVRDGTIPESCVRLCQPHVSDPLAPVTCGTNSVKARHAGRWTLGRIQRPCLLHMVAHNRYQIASGVARGTACCKRLPLGGQAPAPHSQFQGLHVTGLKF